MGLSGDGTERPTTTLVASRNFPATPLVASRNLTGYWRAVSRVAGCGEQAIPDRQLALALLAYRCTGIPLLATCIALALTLILKLPPCTEPGLADDGSTSHV
jgi:hypothetical protein